MNVPRASARPGICRACCMATCLALASCGPGSDGTSPPVDLRPPVVLAVRSTGPAEVCLEFDEEARVAREKVRIDPALAVGGVTASGVTVTLEAGRQSPGLLYRLEAEAEDARGNSASFVAEFHGFNPRVPRCILNEFITRGTDAHPDLLEIKVLADGDMGGVAVYEGTPGSFDDRLVFPSFEVRAGAFILAHFRPTGDPAEMDETSDPSASGGLDSSPSAYDFWVRGGDGLGGNNGVLSLFSSPGGLLLDGVLYSNRTSESDELYGGFGSAEVLVRASELVSAGGWVTAGDGPAPEDAVNPDGSTSTRSICRWSSGEDTDGAADWHIVPTRGSTFGAENSDEVYVPQQ
jgi:hypothetical protein